MKICDRIRNRIKRMGVTENSFVFSHLFTFIFYIIRYNHVKNEILSYSFPSDYKFSLYSMIYDIIYSDFYYNMSDEEPTYMTLSLFRKSKLERDQFLLKNYRLVYKKIDLGNVRRLTSNKYDTYSKLSPFYRRHVVKASLPQDMDKLSIFVDKYEKCILKPLSGKKGNGVYVINGGVDELNRLIKEGLLKDDYIAEEFIKQDEVMASLHNESVNTIRFVIARNKGTLHHLYAMLRIGVNGNIVDNASAGGICAAVDVKTGRVISEGKRRNGEHFLVHPNSNEYILGLQVPKWDELLKMIDDIMCIIPDVKYVGWDFALSKEGWCIIEGNSKPSFLGIQMCIDRGIKYLIDSIVVHE